MRRSSRLLALALLVAALAVVLLVARRQPAAGGGELPRQIAPRPTGAAISVRDLMSRLYAFADDSMLGREAGTVGNVRATDYLAREAARIGLRPAGEGGTYFQSLPFVQTVVDPARLRLAADGEQPLAFGRDYLPVVAPGAPRAVEGARAIYGGAPEGGGHVRLAPQAAAGRLVVVDARENRRAARLVLGSVFRGPLTGAAGVALVVAESEIAAESRYARRRETRAADARDSVSPPSFFVVTRAAAERLLGASLAGLAVGAEGRVVRGTPAFATDVVPARNVVAVLPGRDPALRGQYVALGAHSDHVGLAAPVDHDELRASLEGPAGRLLAPRRRGPERADSVNNGADDDASGSVALLEIAEALAAAPARPRRSVLFVWHTAEELGMVGSRRFTERPTVPLDSIVAHINLDMIGRGGADDVRGGGPRHLQVIGARRLSRELGDVVEAVNEARAEPFRLDWSWDAPDHPERIYCRSDHYMYARKGIPVAFFMTGLHRDYHQRTDEPQYIDYPKLAAVAGYVRDLVVRLADRDGRPKVDGARDGGC